MRAERVRQRDALRFAAREGARQPVEREIAETDVVDKAHACAQLAQDMVRHGLLERGKGQMLEPGGEIGGRQRRRVGDRLARHAHRERFGLEPRAAASGARFRELVLPQKYADVLLVALLLESLEERKDPEVAAVLVVEQKMSIAGAD